MLQSVIELKRPIAIRKTHRTSTLDILSIVGFGVHGDNYDEYISYLTLTHKKHIRERETEFASIKNIQD